MASVTHSIDKLINLLKPGMRLSAKIEFGPDDEYAFSSQYIGCKPDGYLLIDLPMKAREALLMRKLENVLIVVRGITQTKLGNVIAFKTSILTQTNKPGCLLFLRMPQHFASKPIREHERYNLHIPATLTNNTVSYESHLIDFSVSGCAFFVKGENELETQSMITVDSELNDLLPEDIRYQVVSISRYANGHRLGIKFEPVLEMSDDLRTCLLEKVYELESV